MKRPAVGLSLSEDVKSSTVVTREDKLKLIDAARKHKEAVWAEGWGAQ